jgi:hypothetical protein
MTKPGAERLDGPDRVIATPVEPPVHHLLDTAAGRLKQRRHGQGRAGYRPARRIVTDPTGQLPQQ